MAAKKPKRIEVLSTKVKQLVDSPESEMTFEDILIFMNGRKCYDEFKEYELKLIDTKLNNCIVGIIITGQNKNLPAKREGLQVSFTLLILIQIKKLFLLVIYFYTIKV